MSPKRRERDRRLGSGCGKSCKLAQRLLRLAATDLVHKGLDRNLGAIADDGVDVLRCHASVTARKQRKLGDLGARQGLIGAEPRHEIAARFAIDLEASLVQLLVD